MYNLPTLISNILLVILLLCYFHFSCFHYLPLHLPLYIFNKDSLYLVNIIFMVNITYLHIYLPLYIYLYIFTFIYLPLYIYLTFILTVYLMVQVNRNDFISIIWYLLYSLPLFCNCIYLFSLTCIVYLFIKQKKKLFIKYKKHICLFHFEKFYQKKRYFINRNKVLS